MGAPYYDNGNTDEGKVMLFYGSPQGLQGLVGQLRVTITTQRWDTVSMVRMM